MVPMGDWLACWKTVIVLGEWSARLKIRMLCDTLGSGWYITGIDRYTGTASGRSSAVERQLPKLKTRVRLPSPALSVAEGPLELRTWCRKLPRSR